MTDLRLIEPDPSLFAIKDEYFPETQAILNARTLFMEGFSGHEMLKRKIAEILTAPGRISLVQNRNDADPPIAVHEPMENHIGNSARSQNSPQLHRRISGVITTIGHNRLSTSYLGCYQE